MAEWFNENVDNIIPRGSIDIPPSAELNTGQVDPIIYEYHDLLFSKWVEEWNRWDPTDVLKAALNGTLEKLLGWEEDHTIMSLFKDSPEAFVDDLERWWGAYQGLGVAKRIQAPPVCAVSKRAFGWDHRESQLGAYYTSEYFDLKDKFLNGDR
jgi:NAD+ synthase (glutamine-hydrolysing)